MPRSVLIGMRNMQRRFRHSASMFLIDLETRRRYSWKRRLLVSEVDLLMRDAVMALAVATGTGAGFGFAFGAGNGVQGLALSTLGFGFGLCVGCFGNTGTAWLSGSTT